MDAEREARIAEVGMRARPSYARTGDQVGTDV